MRAAPAPLVGRRAERAWLLDRLQNAARGAPQCVVLRGEAGVGKTRLAAELRAEASRLGFVPTLGRGYEGVSLPLLAFRDGVLPALAALLDDGGGAPVALTRARDPAAVAPEAWDEAAATSLLLDLVELVLAAAARRPLLLMLDDMQWCDSSSLALVRHLVDRLASGPRATRVFLLLLTRPTTRLAAIDADPWCARLELGRLEELAAIELARELGLTAMRAHDIWQQTRGNPLLIEALAQEGARPTEATDLHAAFDIRYDKLSSDAVTVLERAALLVPDLGVDTLVRAARTDEATVLAAIDEAILAGLLVDDDSGLRFAHPIARERCLRDVGPFARARAHADIARALSDSGEPLMHVARHAALAGRNVDRDTVLALTKAAGEQALALCAWPEAAELFEAEIAAAESQPDALEPHEVAAAHFAAGKSRELALDIAAAIRHFERAAAISHAAGDVVGETRARTERLAAALAAGTSTADEVATVERLAGEVQAVAPEVAAEALIDVSQAEWSAFRVDDGIATVARALDLAERHELHGCAAKAYMSRAVARWITVDLDEAVVDLRRGIDATTRTGDLWRRTLPTYRLALPLVWLGRLDEARAAIAAAEALRGEVRSFYEFGLVLAARVALNLLAGDLAAAEADADAALRLQTLSGYQWAGGLVLPALAYTYARRGDDAAARTTLDTWRAIADPRAQIIVDALRAYVDARAGSPAAEPPRLFLVSEPLLGAQDVAVLTVELAACTQSTDSVPAAVELIERTEARGMVVSSGLPVLLARVAADGHALLGRHDRARARYAEANAAAARIGAIGERGLAQLGVARVQAAHDHSAAVGALRRALPDLERAGLRAALADATRLAEELGVAGADARPSVRLVAEERCVLFVDVVESTRLTEELGDDEYRRRARQLERALRLAIADHDGTAIPGINLGDGLVALFDAPQRALRAAFAAVRAAAPGTLRLHVGLHHGRILRDGDLVSGATVNLAARICGESSPDEVLVSAKVKDVLTASPDAHVPFVDRGVHRLKGVAEPQHLFAALANP